MGIGEWLEEFERADTEGGWHCCWEKGLVKGT